VEKDKAIKIGLLLVITIGFLYWGFNFLKGKNVFTRTNTYYAYYERIDGLQPSASILLRGYKIGQVTDIYFTNKKYESLTIEMSIDESVEIPENTIAQIFSSDIMGTKSINLIMPYSQANEDVVILSHNSILLSDIEGGLQDQVRLEMAPLKKQVELLIEQAAVAIEQIKYVLNESTGEELRSSFVKIQQAVDAIRNSSVTIDSVLSNHNIQNVLAHVENITKTISNKSDDIQEIVDNVASFSNALAQANIAETVLMTDSVLTELNVVLQRVNAGEGSLGTLLQSDELYKNLETSSMNLDKLLRDVKENPKRYVSFPIFNFSRDKKNK
jgi:phospholipid/cholesterol/gamma-HCH transport system substrate-binding protein